MEKIIKELDINCEFEINGDTAEASLKDSNHFFKIYSLLDNSNYVDIIEDRLLINEHVSEILFDNEECEIKLIGNFDTDMYKCIITKR